MVPSLSSFFLRRRSARSMASDLWHFTSDGMTLFTPFHVIGLDGYFEFVVTIMQMMSFTSESTEYYKDSLAETLWVIYKSPTDEISEILEAFMNHATGVFDTHGSVFLFCNHLQDRIGKAAAVFG